jgi:uncharacterized Zn finger protein (UPF0148 family)
MPCCRCGTREVDPVRGPSAWKRGVQHGSQVLVCPACQHDPGWTALLDTCGSCGSTRLIRQLGTTVCRACDLAGADPVDGAASQEMTEPPQTEPPEQTEQSTAAPKPIQPDADRSALAGEVGEALTRLWARQTGSDDR